MVYIYNYIFWAIILQLVSCRGRILWVAVRGIKAWEVSFNTKKLKQPTRTASVVLLLHFTLQPIELHSRFNRNDRIRLPTATNKHQTTQTQQTITTNYKSLQKTTKNTTNSNQNKCPRNAFGGAVYVLAAQIINWCQVVISKVVPSNFYYPWCLCVETHGNECYSVVVLGNRNYCNLGRLPVSDK